MDADLPALVGASLGRRYRVVRDDAGRHPERARPAWTICTSSIRRRIRRLARAHWTRIAELAPRTLDKRIAPQHIEQCYRPHEEPIAGRGASNAGAEVYVLPGSWSALCAGA